MTTPTPLPKLVRAGPLTAVTLLVAACSSVSGPGAESPASERPARSGAAVEPVSSESAPAAIGEVPEALMAEMLADAAERTGVDIEALEVRRAEAETWNDGSLGCPEPGMMYTQALVDGYHVEIDADGTELDYRATSNGTFRLCENPGPPSGG
jgi:hypothetical protein